jgi:hypothetical protein
MKNEKGSRKILFLAIVLSLVTGTAYTQKRNGQSNAMPRYNTATEVSLKGIVASVETHTGKMGWNGTHLLVSFGGEILPVHVGPSNYLAQQGFSFAAGDEVEVTGSRVKFEGSDVLIAREIRRGEKVLTLRNSEGIPVWSKSKRRQ